MNQRKRFEQLTQERLNSAIPASKAELIEYAKAGVAALEEDEQDMESVQDIGLAIQSDINSSRLYDINKKLQSINDELLGFEDFNRVLDDKDEIKTTFNKFKKYLKSLPEQLEEIL